MVNSFGRLARLRKTLAMDVISPSLSKTRRQFIMFPFAPHEMKVRSRHGEAPSFAALTKWKDDITGVAEYGERE
jgi:hypothetical protein